MGATSEEPTLFETLFAFFEGLHLPIVNWTFGTWEAYITAGMFLILALVNALFALTTWYTYMERRLLGRFQGRLGPNRTGPFGLLQPIADAIKLLTKEDILPVAADRWVFNLAPIVMMAPTFLMLAVIPFGTHSFLTDLNIGILYIAAISSIGAVAVLMAGWGSANKYALFGSMRAIAALISYEIPVLLALLGVVISTGSMSLVDTVVNQRLPLAIVQPLGFLIFLIGISAELNRTPFDLTEAESEIIAGFHTEYSGMKFGAFYLAEFGNLLIASGFITILFLQGWKGPWLPAPFWFLAKIFVVAFIFIWIRATLPRLRIDQVLSFAWKFLLPLSLINITALSMQELFWTDPSTLDLLLISGINWVIAITGIFVFGSIISKQKTSYPASLPLRINTQ